MTAPGERTERRWAFLGIGMRGHERLYERRWTLNSRFVIGKPGNPMMERWRLVQTPWFGLYVHFIYREDLDPVPHDHPWRFWSLILRGGYDEHLRVDARQSITDTQRSHRRGSLHGFPLESAHQITSVLPRTTTLVLVGRKVRVWGFYDDCLPGDGWVDYRDALRLRPTEGLAGTGKRPGRRLTDHAEVAGD